ncbi:hypothetical protein MRB53_032472 [Persea americana]|uniref:Uncharacterized protein n=1 Tax=Persea americana TaxID=3435 RepID=A0ACC2KT23_PERAE|nr:hypothetical protein MRB53_032472 [Persea americana]
MGSKLATLSRPDNIIEVLLKMSSLSKQKPVITLNAFGLPVGKHSTQLASRCDRTRSMQVI